MGGPGGRPGRTGGGGAQGGIRRQQGIAREQVLDVHQQELLVLLLVLDAQLDQRTDRRIGAGPSVADGSGAIQELGHGGVHVAPVGGHLVDARSGDQAALGPRVLGTDPLVVGVEQGAVGGMDGHIALEVGFEEERLEEPRGVGPVPLGGAGVGHRLGRLVLGGEGIGQRLGQAADGGEPTRGIRRGGAEVRCGSGGAHRGTVPAGVRSPGADGEPAVGIEPTIIRFRDSCFTTKLHGQILVRGTGFEPATFWLATKCSTKLN